MSVHEQTEERIAAMAVGDEGDAETRREVMDHLADCDACRDLYRDLRAVSGDLALAADPIPVSAGLEQRVLAAARAADRSEPAAAKPRRFTLGIAAAVAAIAVLGGSTIQLARNLSDERARVERIETAAALLGDPLATRYTMDEDGGDGRMTLAVAPDGRAVLVGRNLRLPAGHVYEIWLIRGTDLVPGQVFTPEDGIAIVPLTLKLNRDVGVAITVERHRVEEPTTQPVFHGSLTA